MVKASFIVVPLLLTTALLLGAGSDNKPTAQRIKAADPEQQPDNGNTATPAYCPQYLMGEYNGTYYYYAQDCSQCSAYAQIAVSKAYNCGGCCSYPSTCCSNNPPCSDQIPGLSSGGGGVASAGDKPAAPVDPYEVLHMDDAAINIIDDTEVVENANGTYGGKDVHFCASAPRFKVTEFLLEVIPPPPPTTITDTYYFRCFDVVNLDDPRQHIRVGHELTSPAWSIALKTPAKVKVAPGFDWQYTNIASHHQRAGVTLDNETAPMNCYLFSNSNLPLSP